MGVPVFPRYPGLPFSRRDVDLSHMKYDDIQLPGRGARSCIQTCNVHDRDL